MRLMDKSMAVCKEQREVQDGERLQRHSQGELENQQMSQVLFSLKHFESEQPFKGFEAVHSTMTVRRQSVLTR